jgi:hypothetical protein
LGAEQGQNGDKIAQELDGDHLARTPMQFHVNKLGYSVDCNAHTQLS